MMNVFVPSAKVFDYRKCFKRQPEANLSRGEGGDVSVKRISCPL